MEDDTEVNLEIAMVMATIETEEDLDLEAIQEIIMAERRRLCIRSTEIVVMETEIITDWNQMEEYPFQESILLISVIEDPDTPQMLRTKKMDMVEIKETMEDMEIM